MLSESIFGRFLGGIFWQETPNLIDSYMIALKIHGVKIHGGFNVKNSWVVNF